MKQRPIFFSTPMVQAIRKGTKTQTRRIVNPQPIKGLHTFLSPSTVLDGSDRTTWIYSDKESSNCIEVKCKYGQPGDVLWVKETYSNLKVEFGYYMYKADSEEIGMSEEDMKNHCYQKKWKPSIFMPKSAARIWLKITNVRLEQLQDISRGAAMAEGCPFPNMQKGSNPVEWFENLWQSINGGNWNTDWSLNPFVWVIEFEQIEKPD